MTITAEGTVYGRVNTPADFFTPSPWLQHLKGDWECALVEIAVECEYSPRSDRLYLCSDIVDESYINGRNYSLLRNIETRGRNTKIHV